MIKKNTLYFSILFLPVLVLCTIFSVFKFASVISLVVFCVFLVYILTRYTIFYIRYFYILFIVLATITSCVFLEFQHFFLNELRVFSGFNGCIPLLSLTFYALISTIIFFDKKYQSKMLKTDLFFKDKLEISVIKYISIIVLFLLLLCFMNVALHPAFLYGLERFDYSQQYGVTGLISKIVVNIPRMIVFPFILVISTKGKNRKIGISCLVLSILYFFWVGNKFGAFFELMCIFLMLLSGYIINRWGKEKFIKIILRIGVVFIVLVSLTLVIQSFTYQGGSILNYFSSRLTAEGQMWWGIYGVSGGQPHISELSDELQVFELGNQDVTKSVGAHYGIYKMMYLVAPNDYVDHYLAAGYRYTEAGFAVAYYYFGALGPILYAFVMGCFFACMTNCILISINKRQILHIYIYLRLWLYGTTAFSMFIFSPFFNVKSIFTYIYLIMTFNKNMTFSNVRLKVKL